MAARARCVRTPRRTVYKCVSYASVEETRRLALDPMLVKLILMPVTIFFATTIALP